MRSFPGIAEKLNMGAASANGEFLLLLNDDIDLISADWIEAMLEQGTKEGVGVVGPKLLYPNETIQHVGVAFSSGLPDHIHKNFPKDYSGYFFSSSSCRNYLAVTGACMLVRKKLFFEVDGYSDILRINYNDIDFCLKIFSLGYRIVYTPHAELFHYESMSREAIVDEREMEVFLQRWNHLVKKDPYYDSDIFDAKPPNFLLRSDF